MLTERFAEALLYATRLHRTQLRKGTAIPYVEHLLGVTSIVLAYGGAEDEAIGALLHDAVEDQGGWATREELRLRFGEAVTAIVDGCTDTYTVPKPPWRARKEGYLQHLPQAGPAVRLVSAADKLHNARSILRDYRALGEQVWGRFNGGREGTLWYYQALVQALRSAGSNALVDELARTVDELQRLAGDDPASQSNP